VELYFRFHICLYGMCRNRFTFKVTGFLGLRIVGLINTQLYGVRSYERCLNTVMKTLNRMDLPLLNGNLLEQESGQQPRKSIICHLT